ncbi:MAG: 16S rRNA (guanine(966)-N(2))-methyltransferase RsmD, partial [Gemmatimonadaceae bacterium]|nr:16S rRNA (guanine(966)-N(2))-methyltransferase RsmD [Acetobacteraceae bacterium]
LGAAGWVAPGTLVVAEIGRDDLLPRPDPVDDRTHGAARVIAWRA